MLTTHQYDIYNILIDCGFPSHNALFAVMCPTIGVDMCEQQAKHVSPLVSSVLLFIRGQLINL